MIYVEGQQKHRGRLRRYLGKNIGSHADVAPWWDKVVAVQVSTSPDFSRLSGYSIVPPCYHFIYPIFTLRTTHIVTLLQFAPTTRAIYCLFDICLKLVIQAS